MTTSDRCSNIGRAGHSDWLTHAFEQLAVLYMANQSMQQRHDSDETPVKNSTFLAAQDILQKVYVLVPVAPLPVILPDGSHGDIDIVWEHQELRVEMLVRNDGSGVSCFVSDSGSTREVEFGRQISDSLMKLAS